MDQTQDQPHELTDRINKAWHEIVTMEDRLKAMPSQVDSFNQSLQDLQQIVANTKNEISSITSHYSDYFAKTDPAIKSKLETVTEHHAAIDQFLKASTELKTDLEAFREYIYGNESLNKLGLKNEIELFHENSKIDIEILTTKWGEAYDTIYEKIEGLLPGATATGLSKAYQDQKNSYRWPVITWSIVFGVTVAGMMGFGIWLYTEVKDLSDSLRHILARLPFFIPAVWLAIFASKQQSQYKRLQQEYIYKETLAKSYEAYKREIDQLPESEEKNLLLQKLIASMVDMCGYNPSMTLENKSHNEKPPIPGSSFISKMVNGKQAKEKSELS